MEADRGEEVREAKKQRSIGRTAWWAILLLMAGLFPAASGTAAGAGISLSQSNVTLEAGSSTTLLVTAGAAPRGSYLRFYADAGIEARVQGQGPRYWIVAVRTDSGPSEGLLTVQLLSRGQSLGFAQARVVSRPRPPPEAVAQASLILDGDSLVEGRDLLAFLTVANRSEQVLKVGALRPLAPRGIELLPSAQGPILPRSTLVIPVRIAVSGEAALAPGKHVVGFVIPLAAEKPMRQPPKAAGADSPLPWSGDLVATKEVVLSVPGMSAVEGVLQIPSLLLLPGLLAALTFAAALNRGKPRPPGEDPFSRLSVVLSPGLWVLMIIISGTIGLVYFWLTGRNILYAYSLRDVVCLSAASILAGGVAGGIAAAIEKARVARAAAPRFAKELSPLNLLVQLEREGKPLRMWSRRSQGVQIFDLGPGSSAEEAWACGGIEYRSAAQSDGSVTQGIRSAVAQGKMDQIIRYAREGKVLLAWREFADGRVRVQAPQLVSRDLFKPPLVEDSLVQEAV
jgi:hypothetical protein